MDLTDVESWVRRHVRPVAAIEVVHARPWATVARVPLDRGTVWFKACTSSPFEPRLTARLSAHWPDRIPEVLASDARRGWLLLGDAGTPVRDLGNPCETWLTALPHYAELQLGEAARARDHIAAGVPDLRVDALPGRYPELLSQDLPLDESDRALLRAFEPTFASLCAELDQHGVAASVQHDDLHHANLYLRDGRPCFVDWGDASVGHPFVSLFVTFRFLERVNGLAPGDPWFARLLDAYLEPWGSEQRATFALAMRVGVFAHAIAWIRQRAVVPAPERPRFDGEYRVVLDRTLAAAAGDRVVG